MTDDESRTDSFVYASSVMSHGFEQHYNITPFYFSSVNMCYLAMLHHTTCQCIRSEFCPFTSMSKLK